MFQKKCIVCEKYHPTSEFGEASDGREGYGLICRECLIDRSLFLHTREWQDAIQTKTQTQEKAPELSTAGIEEFLRTTNFSNLGNFSKIRMEELGLGPALTVRLLDRGIRTIGGLKLGASAKHHAELGLSDDDILRIKTGVAKIICSARATPSVHPSDDANNVDVHQSTTIETATKIADKDILSIFQFAAGLFHVPPERVIAHSRKKEYVAARNATIYVLRKHFHVSFPKIARSINRDHTTIIHSYKSFSRELQDYPKSMTFVLDNIRNFACSTLLNLQPQDIKVPQLTENVNEKSQSEDNFLPNLAEKNISERNYAMYLEYKNGKTLNEIAQKHSITRSRTDQIVASVIKVLAARDILMSPSAPNLERALEIEKQLHDAAKKIKQPSELRESKVSRWSRGYDACVRCGLTTNKHFVRGLCEVCGSKSISGNEREVFISKHMGKCDLCGISRQDAKSKYGRDFYISRKQESVLCRKCFSIYTGTKLGHRPRQKRSAPKYKTIEEYKRNSNNEMWYCRSRHTNARGLYDGKSFTLLAGSIIDSYARKSFEKQHRMVAQRNQILFTLCEKIQKNVYRLKNDHRFTSPSAAGTFCLGGSTDGWLAWKNKEGASMHEILRKDFGVHVKRRKSNTG